MSEANINSGERLTFYQLIKNYHIQIPIIQRDYAQGRKNEKEIRDSFVDALYDYLEKNEPNDLDFVYGTIQKADEGDVDKFIPLDGQQRLTTLFLLHWYLANKDGQLEQLNQMLIDSSNPENLKSKFSYETRVSSYEFCSSLLVNDIDLNQLLEPDEKKKNSLSKTLKENRWFFYSWQTDPTIQSMLVMLDTIHEKFNDTKDFFSRLLRHENPVINFQFLDINQLKLTDDLYIKMNSRGIPLSPFENFKAKFEQFISVNSINSNKYSLTFNDETKPVDFKTYFSHKIDTDWANLFWNHTNTGKIDFDLIIMNFIRSIVINSYVNESNIEIIKKLLDKKFDVVSFHRFNKLGIFKPFISNEVGENQKKDAKVISDIVDILDLIKNGNNKVKNYLNNFYYYNEAETFETIIKTDFNTADYVSRIKFHAYCQYLIKWKENGEFLDIKGLERWMRVIFNLVENSAPYNNEKEFVNSINAVNQLVSFSKNILNHIIDLDELSGFDSVQYEEERIKACLILKNENWEKLICPIEKHGYFKGQIGFILFLSEIEDYYHDDGNCNWSESDDEFFQKDFKNYSNKATLIFDDSGLRKELDKPNYLWSRALLSIGDYRISEGSNESFLINFDRDISWKRFLKRDKDKDRHKKIVTDIFKCIDEANVIKSLNNIIKEYKEDDWRFRFINTPKLFDYLGAKRYVRERSNHGFALLCGERMSGYHRELFTYSLFLNSMNNNDFKPFKKVESSAISGDDVNEYPSVSLLDWSFHKKTYAIYIFYDNGDSFLPQPYEICFKKQKGQLGKEEYDEQIIEVLESLKFEWIEDNNNPAFWISKGNEERTLSLLLKICSQFNTL